MNPSSLINPANPGSPIWIANQVAQQNATRTAAETSTAAEVNDTAEEGDVEKVVVFNLNDTANQEEPAAGSAADPLKDDPNEPWGDEPETEGNTDDAE